MKNVCKFHNYTINIHIILTMCYLNDAEKKSLRFCQQECYKYEAEIKLCYQNNNP